MKIIGLLRQYSICLIGLLMVGFGFYCEKAYTEVHLKDAKLAASVIVILENKQFSDSGTEAINSVLDTIITGNKELADKWFDAFIAFGFMVLIFGIPNFKPNQEIENET